MNILVNGNVVCLSTHSNEMTTIKVFNSGEANVTDVIVNVNIPDGLVFESYTASQGTYASGVWTVGTLTPDQDENDPETLELCFTITDDQAAPYIVTYVVTCDECPDNISTDDNDSRTIDGIKCTDLSDCISYYFSCLPSYSDMVTALDALGPGKVFVSAAGGLDGWESNQLMITPSVATVTMTCHTDMVSNDCAGLCYGEVTSNGTARTCPELAPVISGPCGNATIVDIGAEELVYINEGMTFVGSSWTLTYALPCADCASIPACCCTTMTVDEEEISAVPITVFAEFVADQDSINGEGTLTFTIQGNGCIPSSSCSFHYFGPSC